MKCVSKTRLILLFVYSSASCFYSGSLFASIDEYLELTIEDLLATEIVSVSKKPQALAKAAAAIYVITGEDIRRSGATSIPEALRMAPGVHVGRVDSNKWSIGIRGHNSIFGNKILVQLDGRALYNSSSFTGMHWDVQDTMLEDIDRIEVIRGPGATLWGADAVNGIINIITKHASLTQGGLTVVGGGNEEQAVVGFRYGASLDENTQGRIYFKHVARDDFIFNVTDADDATVAGQNAGDNWKTCRAGFRLDGAPTIGDRWTLQGDVYRIDANQHNAGIVPIPAADPKDNFDASGWNLLARWHHQPSETSSMTLQVYYDHVLRDELFSQEKYDTFDIDFQQHIQLGGRHDLVWGMGYRRTDDDFKNTVQLALNPDQRTVETFNAFVQDEITLFEDKLYLTLGTKFEDNEYTGLEAQPSARLLWQANPRHSLWAAVSRAARTPSRVEVDGVLTARVDDTLFYHGSPDFKSEGLIAYEMGYRAQLSDQLSVDATVFSFDYEDVSNFEVFVHPSLGLQLLWENNLYAKIHGFELAVDWRPQDWWRVQANYSRLSTKFGIERPSANPVFRALVEQLVADAKEGSSPAEMFTLRSSMDLGNDWELDTWINHVGRIPIPSLGAEHREISIDSLTSLNARLAWKPRPGVELSISGFNLNDDRHLQFLGESIVPATEVERSIYAQARWKFN